MEFEMPKSRVYIRTDGQSRITRCEGEYTLPFDLDRWILIEEGQPCDRLNLAQSHYFPGGLYTMDGIPRYRWDGSAAVLRTEEELEADRAARPEPIIPPTNAELAEENKLLKQQVSAQSAVASITFVAICEVGTLDAVTASEHAELFAEWAYPIAYTVGQLRRHNGKLYRCVQAHTSQADWTPDTAESLWSVAADPAEEWPAWSQPVGAHDAYAKGAKVSHNAKHWTSSVDNNVWEPGVYGWTEYTE